jgi:maleylacetate reductase
VAAPYPNPRPVTRAGVRALLDDAFHGRRPTRPAT